MTVSYNWLKEYIDLPESAEEIAETLTSTGLEVESVHPFDSIKGGLKGLVIGEVLTCIKHPKADKLSLTTVDVGQPAPLSIVCGAPNVKAGQKVIVATPGTTLYPSKGDPFIIQSTKIRGEQSDGMICAEDEIGIGDDHGGIIILSTDKPNGTPASAYFNIHSDQVIEIGLTPNRADAASHIGVARDIKAAKQRTVKWPNVDSFKVTNKSLPVEVVIENTEACPRYSALTLSNVEVKDSPAWLKNRLLSIGLTPINNVVDVTNFICHELGQPLHAFDAEKTGKKVIVKTLPAGTKFTTLDNKERTLTQQDLMICNATEGMCIAGVFGGIRSGITTSTRTIFLESACFSPAYVRRTSMAHQLKTDAAFRFARGTDPELTVFALKRAAILLQEVAGAVVTSDVIDVYPKKIESRSIKVKDKHVSRLIGKMIDRQLMVDILERLDIRVISQGKEEFVVSVPPYRVDVEQEADVIEEILRIYGFNNIPLSESTKADYLADFPPQDINTYKRRIGEMLASNGFYEILTNSLTNKSYQEKHGLRFSGEPVEILNKLSEEQGILRQTMLFTGLEVAAHNFNRKQSALKCYEFGRIYSKQGSKYEEEDRLALYVAGQRGAESWLVPQRSVQYHDVLQHCVQVLEKSACPEYTWVEESTPLLEYGVKFMQGGRELGRAGKVRQALAKDFGIKQEIFYADFATSLLFQFSNPKFDIQDVPKFPEVRRDLSLVLDKGITFNQIREIVGSTGKKLITGVTVFDVYEGDKIPPGKKAYALGFTLLDPTKTLTDDEIDNTMNGLMATFEKKLGAVIRK
ncbi:MAG: phenylalanine--tRNA ligase subunit beta [Cyclobacteriaceae bacterium]|nr:phenylalanine--tRNA ligase subunit beta [Cyclobacteriaceae bacterium]